ncbi:MAG: cellulase family glycosylhydrolase [Microbacterium sp.]
MSASARGRSERIAVCARAVCAAGAALLLALTGCTAEPAPSAVSVDLPHVAQARVGVAGWTLAEPAEVSSVAAQVGDAASGSIAVTIDSASEQEAVALSQTVTVSASTSYRLSAMVRVLSSSAVAVPASIQVGEAVLDLPDLNAAWQRVTLEVETDADQTTLDVELVVDGIVSGLGIDDVQLTPVAGGSDLIDDGGFETITTDAGIRNETLILDQATAAFAIASSSSFDWTVTDTAGAVVDSGQDVEAASLTAVSLAAVTQGYYTVTVTTSGGDAWETPFIVIDTGGQGIQADARFGVGTHVERDPYVGTIDAALDSAQALGFAAIRNDVTWSKNETTAGTYTWGTDFVDAFDQLGARGMTLLPVVGYNNKLYDDNETVSSATGLAAYAAYAAAVVERFDTDQIEVYNEFNHNSQSNNSCGQTADCYLPLLKAAYQAVKAADPSVEVVAGATALYAGDWFTQLWSLGGLDYADVMSFHPYEVADSSPTLGDPDLLKQIVQNAQTDMDAYADGQATPAISVTEIGWSTKTGGAGLDQQGGALVRTTVAALAGGATSVYWYDLVNDEADAADHEGNFGIFFQQVDGVAAYPPKPAAMARAVLAAKITGLELSAVESFTDDFTSVAFGQDDPVRVAWSANGSYQAVYTASGTVTVTTSAGVVTQVEPVDGVVTVPLTSEPVFVEGATGVAAS